MVDFILWYLLITLLGLLTFPLAYRLFGNLADSGYFLSRPLGLLFWGYIFWMLTTLQLVQNNPGGALFALSLLALISVIVIGRGGWENLRAWFTGNGVQLRYGTGLSFQMGPDRTLVVVQRG